jgi:hypothetical protein
MDEELKAKEDQKAALEASIAELTKTQEALTAHQATATQALLATIPEQFRALVPAGTPLAQLAWIESATKAGLFNKPAVPTTDDGRKPTITPKDVDTSTLSPYARLSAAYSK